MKKDPTSHISKSEVLRSKSLRGELFEQKLFRLLLPLPLGDKTLKWAEKGCD